MSLSSRAVLPLQNSRLDSSGHDMHYPRVLMSVTEESRREFAVGELLLDDRDIEVAENSVRYKVHIVRRLLSRISKWSREDASCRSRPFICHQVRRCE